jgi:hypothetical protein
MAMKKKPDCGKQSGVEAVIHSFIIMKLVGLKRRQASSFRLELDPEADLSLAV